MRTVLLIAALPLTLAACSGPDLRVTDLRVRTDLGAALDSDGGWGTTVDTDTPFRLRVEVEAAGAGHRLGLQARRNGGEWVPLLARDHPYPDEISSPWASIVEPTRWTGGSVEAGTPTTDLLQGSDLDFAGGAAVGLDSLGAPVPVGQSEWEWTLVVRRWSDGATRVDAGDRIEFRVTDGSGAPVAGVGAEVEVAVPAGHLGGTYAETPGRLGPWQSSDGRLWFPMEPAETFNVLMMMSSADGGVRWDEVDGADRPRTDDLEGVATAFRDGRIHLLHQISERVVYHAFATTDEGDPGWVVRDEEVATHAEPPVQVAALEALGDGRLVAVFANGNDLEIRLRGTTGEWSAPRSIPAPEGRIHSGVQSAVDAGGRVHLAWTRTNGLTGSVLHTVLQEDGTPGVVRTLADDLAGGESDVGALAPLVPLAQEGVAVIWRRGTGQLIERRMGAEGPLSLTAVVTDGRVAQNAVDSDQVGADAVRIGDTLYLTFIDEATRELHLVRSSSRGEWSDPLPIVRGIDAQWVRGRPVSRPDGRVVYGYVYDAGSMGGSGMNRYGEYDPGA